MEEIKLPSGAILKITLAPFADSLALFQAICEEGGAIKINEQDDVDINFFKDIFCKVASSKKIESALWKCMQRVTYNDLKLDAQTFEAEGAREDYFVVCLEVGRKNVLPFTKNLSAQYKQLSAITIGDQK